jgi:hypothetical protein
LKAQRDTKELFDYHLAIAIDKMLIEINTKIEENKLTGSR